VTDALSTRLAQLESEAEIRRLGARYAALCDEPPAAVPVKSFEELFTADCVWEGIGQKAASEFARVEGRERLIAWFGAMRDAQHYAFNVHLLTSEQIEVNAGSARGTWVMFQVATQQGDLGELRIARLHCRFRLDEAQWRIAHFQTESLLRLDMDTARLSALLGFAEQ
jgi:hypothetical protein